MYPQNLHHHYHAHFYFNQHSSEFAAEIREQIHRVLALYVGRFNQRLVGPHTMWSFEIDFDAEQFSQLLEWLETHRNGHSVLIHAVTGNDYLDHTEYVYWLGDPVELDLRGFLPQ
ncbi:DOPA 4,5-dioxygenase family protein [Vibrio sp. 404]|uniref:DOPA 4,5-dioxygenase family protein n=1 Tax=Vibrio marinisediminis TaxID=2758441 RepID=A0A7W2FNZ1_9VIBR|nr:DOPA 4,5-dioxygenase family protein [Vibrio marinisediminis]MBA5761582.1 DOPA 4,5-dioxygenase family protein [Vibrio marinisediminis]